MTLSRLMTLLTAGTLFVCTTPSAQPVPPVAEKHPHILQMAGESRTDDYYWLRDDSRQNPKVLNYLRAENQYSARMMSGWAALTETLYQEMRARQGEHTESVPYELRGYRYQQRYLPGKDYAQYLRQPVSGNAVWQTLWTPASAPPGTGIISLAGWKSAPIISRWPSPKTPRDAASTASVCAI